MTSGRWSKASAVAGAAAIVAAARRFGRLDVVVSNAGFADRRPIGELDCPGYEASMAAMQNAFFDLLLAARPWLEKARRTGRGRVVVRGPRHTAACRCSRRRRRQGRHQAMARLRRTDGFVRRHGELRRARLRREGRGRA
jgi:hypothetical protein